MSSKLQRSTLFHVNKHQRIYFYPVISAFLLGCAVSWLSVIYFLFIDIPFGSGFAYFQGMIPLLLSAAAILMIIMVFWTCRLTNRYLGGYDRIVSELDEVLAGKRNEPIQTREGDTLFMGLLKRINVLISRK